MNSKIKIKVGDIITKTNERRLATVVEIYTFEENCIIRICDNITKETLSLSEEYLLNLLLNNEAIIVK